MNYKIIDNFLNNDDFSALCSLKLEKINPRKIRVYNNRIHNNGKIDRSCLDENLLKKLHQNYHAIAINLLKELNPKKIIDVQSLAGDSSDNVPGVPGIGIKIAAELINKYGVSTSENSVRNHIIKNLPSWAKPIVDEKGNLILIGLKN